MADFGTFLFLIGLIVTVYGVIKIVRNKFVKHVVLSSRIKVISLVGFFMLVTGGYLVGTDPVEQTKSAESAKKISADKRARVKSRSEFEKHKQNSKSKSRSSSESKSRSEKKAKSESAANFSSSSHAVSISKAKKADLSYKKVKVGMTYAQMIKVAGKPDYDGYKDYEYVTYDDKNIYFDKGKVRGGDTKELVDEVKKNGDKKKKQEQEDREILQYRAERFGQKTVESLQRPNSPYQSEKVNEGMIYTTKYNGEMLVRLDTDDGYTYVSEFDKNSTTGMGKNLYTGKTILHDSPRYIVQN